MHRKYPWPCSRLERDLMHELHCESKLTGEPITALVAEAVTSYLNHRFACHAPIQAPSAPAPTASPLSTTAAADAAA